RSGVAGGPGRPLLRTSTRAGSSSALLVAVTAAAGGEPPARREPRAGGQHQQQTEGHSRALPRRGEDARGAPVSARVRAVGPVAGTGIGRNLLTEVPALAAPGRRRSGSRGSDGRIHGSTTDGHQRR